MGRGLSRLKIDGKNKRTNKQINKKITEEPKPYLEIRTTFYDFKMSLFDLDEYPNILPSTQNDLALKTNTPSTIQITFAAS